MAENKKTVTGVIGLPGGTLNLVDIDRPLAEEIVNSANHLKAALAKAGIYVQLNIVTS